MKNIINHINESKEIECRCAFSDISDKDGLPISCSIIIESKYINKLLEFAKKEEGNAFIHFCDNKSIVCY